MKSVLLILTVFLFSAGFSSAQNAKIDSLKNVFKTAKADTVKVNILNDLARELIRAGSYDTAMKYATDAKTLAEKAAFKKGVAKAFNVIGMVYYRRGKYAEALQNDSQSLYINREINDQEGVASAYSDIGIVYQNQGNYTEAMRNYLLAQKIYEQHGIINNGFAYTYLHIGTLYFYQFNYPEALKNYLRAEKIMEQLGDKKGIAECYSNVGNIYNVEGDYDAALKNYNKAMKLQEEVGDGRGMSNNYNNIGTIYFNQGNYPMALKNYFGTLKICREKEYRYGIAESYVNIGNVYARQKNYEEARNYLINGMKASIEIGARENLKDAYQGLAEVEASQGDYKNAYAYTKLFSEIKDSLVKQNNSKQMDEMKTKYETEKKDKEMEIQTVKIDNQKTIIRYLVAGFVLLNIFALVYFRLYNQKRKTAFRHQVLETEMKALRSQMNSHFTFNVLNSIQYFVRANDMKSAEVYLNKFSRLIRMVLDQSRNSYILLEQEINMLKLYLELEQMLFEKKFDYSIDVDTGLDAGSILIPGMLIQPIVENSIKHGLEYKEGEAFVNISFMSHNSTLLCSVTDNGIGRDAARQIKNSRKSANSQNAPDAHKSAATSIINERMEALSSIYNIHFTCKTEDLSDSSGKTTGTRVSLELPINTSQST